MQTHACSGGFHHQSYQDTREPLTLGGSIGAGDSEARQRLTAAAKCGQRATPLTMGSGGSSSRASMRAPDKAATEEAVAAARQKKRDSRRATIAGFMNCHEIHVRMLVETGNGLSKEKVKSIYPDCPPDVFNAVYGLFDWDEKAEDGGLSTVKMFSLMLISIMVSPNTPLIDGHAVSTSPFTPTLHTKPPNRSDVFLTRPGPPKQSRTTWICCSRFSTRRKRGRSRERSSASCFVPCSARVRRRLSSS